MAERLVVISDMWGAKKGLWITSYLGYLQQYFDIVFYDSQQLAHLELEVSSEENILKAFMNGGMETALAHILKKESKKSHYLTFCAGGTIAWKANLKGLPMKSLYAISPFNFSFDGNTPECPVKLLYGEYQKDIPSFGLMEPAACTVEVVPNFGHDLYTDEKIIQKVCLELLENLLNIRNYVRKPLSAS